MRIDQINVELKLFQGKMEKLINEIIFGDHADVPAVASALLTIVVEILRAVPEILVSAPKQAQTLPDAAVQADTLKRIIPALCEDCGRRINDAVAILVGQDELKAQEAAPTPKPVPAPEVSPPAASAAEKPKAPPVKVAAKPPVKAVESGPTNEEYEEMKRQFKEVKAMEAEEARKKRGRPKGSKNKPKPSPPPPPPKQIEEAEEEPESDEEE